MELPSQIETEAELDELLSRPSPDLIAFMRQLQGDLAILGVAGKMGVTLALAAARAAREAATGCTVYGVSRFSDAAAAQALRAGGVKTIACDLLDRRAVAALPQVPNVIFMAGRKFGTIGQEPQTWAMNTLVPANVCEHFRTSRIVALSTGCVYPLVPIDSAGCVETDPADPVGEYAQSCLGRERVFQHYATSAGIPLCIIRLNYAVELRYGVFHDLASRIWQGAPVDLAVPCFNAIWQGDANERILRALDLCATPTAAILNLTGSGTIWVKEAAEALGRSLGRPIAYGGSPGPVAYLNDASHCVALFGPPRMPLARVREWTARWIMRGGRSLGKPTHFEVNNGKF